MNKKNVLIVSNKLDERNPLRKWTEAKHAFDINIVSSDEAAIELCHIDHFDLVVVDGTDDKVDTKKLYAVLPILQDNATLLRYDGETAEELDNNIKAVFNAKKYKR